MSDVAIVCPGYPDVRGGVRDHTARLVRHWHREEEDDGRYVQVHGALGVDPAGVARRLRVEGVGALLLQYVPFLYGRFGLSRFPERLLRAARGEGLRITTFVHEPWVPPTRLPWLVLSPLQRRQLRRLVGLSDAVVTPVPVWAERLDPAAHVVCVGSTMGEPRNPPPEPEAHPVVFSPFAAGLRWRWIVAAVNALGASPPLVVVGATADEMRVHPATRRWFDPRWECRGYLEAQEALRVIGAARLALAPFVDGATGRRTSLFALLSTGVRVVSSRGRLFDPLFERSPAATPATERAFAQAALERWNDDDRPEDRDERLTWYRERVAPERLDDRLLNIVGGTAA